MSKQLDKVAVVAALNKILETELAGVVRYTHYSLMIFGHGRIPIVSWLREQATESLLHANDAGEMITSLGEHPSLEMGPLLETYKHDIDDILRESLENERLAVKYYRDLLKLVEGQSLFLEEYARRMVAEEEMHMSEVDKMLRKPGEISSFLNS